MDTSSEVREFLTSRRARVTPEQAGLRAYGGLRRVPGLRREEVAMLAGVSVDYYTRLERGDLAGASEQVLDGIAQALHLDDTEREHLYHLARAAGPGRTPHPTSPVGDGAARRPASPRLDAQHTGVRAQRPTRRPGHQRSRAGPVLDMYADPRRPVNHARFNFLDPAARRFWSDWDRAAHDTVAILRAEAGRDPYDKELTALVGELSTRSEEFRRLWASHDVKRHDIGVKTFVHPVVGRLDLPYESLELTADTGLTVLVYSAEPGSPSDDGLQVLASWAATNRAAAARATDGASAPPPDTAH